MNLFINYFVDKNKERQKEYDSTLLLNIQNRYIDNIYLIVENKDRVKYKRKITYIEVNKRPTFQDFFNIINRITKDNEINIIANSDIYFNETLDYVNLYKNECLALTRNDLIGSPESQDVWIFKGKIKKINSNIKLGVWGCDNAIAYEIKKAGYDIYNPSLSISCFHNHKSQFKNDSIKKYSGKILRLGNNKLRRNKYKFSIIMSSLLSIYKDCAEQRERKFVRAVKSVLAQTFDNYELIIIADGCEKTTQLYIKHFSTFTNIKCLQINKQRYLAGKVRQIGIENAKGDYIIYLDTDDYFGENHLSFINAQIKNLDWCYFNDIINSTPIKIKNVVLDMGLSGTSSICHKRGLGNWNNLDGYTHDMRFIETLMKNKNYKKLKGNSEYYICHIVNSLDV